jgi:hypothetical protein
MAFFWIHQPSNEIAMPVCPRDKFEEPADGSNWDAGKDLLRLYRRQGYERAPVGMNLCPALENEFRRRYPDQDGDYLEYFGAPYRILYDPGFAWNFVELSRVPGREKFDARKYYPNGFQHAVQMTLVSHESIT